MNKELQALINEYIDILVKEQQDNVILIRNGYIEDNCFVSVFPILIHCLENIDIFTQNQVNNVKSYIKTILDGKQKTC